MDAKKVGQRISELRRKNGMTQQILADKLDVSDKAVSKWENGQGYPDITIFPRLSTLFGVTVDYLLFGKKKGIAIAGSIIADIVKKINFYPKPGMMAQIGEVSPAVGGCAPNTAINLAKIDSTIPVSVYGKVGSDENGHFIVSAMQKHGISTEGIIYSQTSATSFCDVMSIPTGERTFFHKKGANAEFGPEEVDTDSIDASIFHIGYLLLLDRFDEEDSEYGTLMGRFLHSLQKKGIKTSIDVVSDTTTRYAKVIIPALRYCNYAIMNEVECLNIWNMQGYDDEGNLVEDNVKEAMKKMADCGVKDKVVIHSKEISFVLDVASGEFTRILSLNIPKDEIKGNVGAGDAFCAGCLYGLYNGYDDKTLLEFASSAAACSLFAVNSTDGMKSKQEILSMSQKYKRLK